MPLVPSSLLQRLRAGLLMLLLVVLPLQGVVQLVAGLQGQRHVHTGAPRAAASPSPLRALLDRLHAAQDPRLLGHRPAWVASRSAAAEEHRHGGVTHRHTAADEADALDVGDPADDAAQGGGTAFLAWLPAVLAVPAGAGSGRPAAADADWRDRVVAPPLTPPRG